MEQQPKLDQTTEIALRSLNDLAMPEPVSWFPQTWGWGLFALILLVLILSYLALWYKRWLRNAYRREAMKQLKAIRIQFQDPDQRYVTAVSLVELVKRVAMVSWSRRSVAALSGENWVKFLAAHDGTHMSSLLSRFLNDLEYRDEFHPAFDDFDAVVNDTSKWVERHNV
ncbi:DUF4381 domain-containing protein [Ochrobactrum vermis]|uniref:DUF4381 domain-containing protein n=1 Tax=Ochrobactrum vermis TaxID=1827297 RepID=A0ABU8PAV4_9HYPH|nr:DUF4381 domain-containing protein [Ochrobactrum vermis]PQZ29321.1 hypothetical protein CQZ93_03385 [Ochrobactrum vermis]